MSYITLPERMILESLTEGAKTQQELIHATKIETSILQEIIRDFVTRNILSLSDQTYSINLNINKYVKETLHNLENIKIEISEIINSSISQKIDNKKENSLKLKKVYMSKKEEKIYRGLIYNLEHFVTSLKSQKGDISEKKIIFWGENTYQDVINYSFNS